MARIMPTLPPIDIMDFMSGKPRKPLSKEFIVGSGRVGNQMAVYVTNDFNDQRFHKFISLKWHWWQSNSPAERIRWTMDKAQRIADKLNHEELYLDYEASIATR